MYKNEELIYTNTVDVSKESGIPNNKVYVDLMKKHHFMYIEANKK